MFRSKFEKVINNLLKRHKVAFEYEPYKLNYVLEKTYIPDFVLADTNIHIEAKGYLKPEDRQKMIAVKKANPDLDIRLWFQKDNYLTKSKKSKYSDWAEKNGFKYHIGEELPKEWLKKM